MTASPTTIELAGRPATIHGNPDDPYFRNAAGLAAELAALEPWFRRVAPVDATVIDAGGNIGLTAITFARLFPAGQVHVFEALPRNAAYLERNLRANGIANVTLNACALGERPGRIAMQGEGSAAHVVRDPAADPLQGVEVTTLDAYAERAGLRALHLLKIDVEGYEPAVLAGGRALLDRTRPVTTMEFNSWCLGMLQRYPVAEFAEALFRLFEVSVIGADGQEHPAGGGDPIAFLHDNVVHRGAVTDVVMRLRPGASMRAFRLEAASGAEAARLRAELEAMRRSTSWRVTAPLRAVRRLVGG
jgi:FkbM family methyltransferase